MKHQDRKAAVAAYKERKVVAGIYALRCAASGQVWVGQAGDLDKVQNRIAFTLRTGAGFHRDLQATLAAHGADAFAFEELERLPEEELDYVRQALVKQRLAHWRAELKAAPI